MRIHYGFENLPEIKGAVVTIGSFDGVHRGHRLLITQLCEIAQQSGGESLVVTFEPHPRQLLKGENRLLTTISEKLTLLAETGVDNVIVVNFTHEFSKISHTEFIQDYIIGKLHAAILITGEGHHFGHNRGGDATTLVEHGIQSRQLERYDNISSTQIRATIEQGRMQEAAELLGTTGYLVFTPITDSSKLLPPPGKYIVNIRGTEDTQAIELKKLLTSKNAIRILREI